MENTTIYTNKVDVIKKLDEKNIKENFDEISNQIHSIIMSYEENIELDELNKTKLATDELLANFYSGTETYFYVYEHKGVPVAFCVYENESESSKAWKMSAVMTHNEYQNNGYAQKLLIESFKELRKQGQEFVVLVVNNENYPSLSVQQNLLKQCKGYTEDLFDEDYGDMINSRTKFVFELKSLDKSLNKESEDEMCR